MTTILTEGPVSNLNLQRRRVSIGGLFIDVVELSEVQERLCSWVEKGEPRHVITANVHFLTIARQDGAFRHIMERADLVVADGMPLVWLSKLNGASIPRRITGFDLLHVCAALSADKGYSIFLLGGGPGAAEATAEQLRALYPGTRITGTLQGQFNRQGYGVTQEVEEVTVSAIREARPDFLFVGLGCPKQEVWIQNHLESAGAAISVGIGSVFDVMAGRYKRAPELMQKVGMEWLYRMNQEPGRLWKRYILGDVPTMVKLGSSSLVRLVRPQSAADSD
jgi:N-acetylglucosaminyldiphosphoundecaprenol N-acetyl-beta-D-mannosaminyltransferase